MAVIFTENFNTGTVGNTVLDSEIAYDDVQGASPVYAVSSVEGNAAEWDGSLGFGVIRNFFVGGDTTVRSLLRYWEFDGGTSTTGNTVLLRFRTSANVNVAQVTHRSTGAFGLRQPAALQTETTFTKVPGTLYAVRVKYDGPGGTLTASFYSVDKTTYAHTFLETISCALPNTAINNIQEGFQNNPTGTLKYKLDWARDDDTITDIPFYQPAGGGGGGGSFDNVTVRIGGVDKTVTSITSRIAGIDYAMESLTCRVAGVDYAVGSDPYGGWDPTSGTSPPERTQRAYFNNTGLFTQALRDQAAANPMATGGVNYQTTANGQIIENADFFDDIEVLHSGVIIRFCKLRKGVDVGGLPSGSVMPKIQYCDAIYNNGVADTGIKNFVSGNADVRRCNISGYLDNCAIKTAFDNTGHEAIFIDNFMHDSRLVNDPGQPGRSHNDAYQSNQNGTSAQFLHNTIWGSGTDNVNSVESWSRDNGPHWTPGATPYDCVFENPSTGGDPVGRINAGACQLKADVGATFIFARNLVAGSMFRVTNATTGNFCDVIDNEVAVAHMDSGNYPFGGTLRTETGNVDWLTKQPIV